MSSSEAPDNSIVTLQTGGPVSDVEQFGVFIGDYAFMRDLEKLKSLRSFLIEQAVGLKPTEAGTISFGGLSLLRYREKGRFPTLGEWQALEVLTQDLFRHLSDPLRRRFLYSRLPWWIATLVLVFGGVAVVSLVTITSIWGLSSANGWFVLPSYIVWLASMGAIGSIAFVGMNALAVQDDATFDLTNTKLLALRISLGALFGIVLTLPFGFESFKAFLTELIQGQKPGAQGDIFQAAAMLLMPFVLGFSTSLVILVLNQLVDAVQTFFGKASSVPSSKPEAEKKPAG